MIPSLLSLLPRKVTSLVCLPADFTRQHHQPGVTAERKTHIDLHPLFLAKATQNWLTSQNTGLGKLKSPALCHQRKARKHCFLNTHFLRRSPGLWGAPWSSGRAAFPHLYLCGCKKSQNNLSCCSKWLKPPN